MALAGRILLAFCWSLLGHAAPPTTLGLNSVVKIRVPGPDIRHAQGSGVVVRPGIVATNAHCMKRTGTVVIEKDGRAWTASSFRMDAPRDLCLLRVPGMDLPEARFAPLFSAEPNQPVIAIGYPGGRGPLVSQGSVHAVWRMDGALVLQADAHIHPGSSGGGLFTPSGELLGITTSVFPSHGGISFSMSTGPLLLLLARTDWHPLPAEPMFLRDLPAPNFLETLSRDPANRKAGESLARAWLEIEPNNPEAWRHLGLSLVEKLLEQGTGDPALQEAAIDAFRQALRLNPRDAKAWNNLGVQLDLQGRLPEALEALHRALAIRSDYAEARLNLGTVLLNSRLWEKAVDAFRVGLQLKPDNAVAWSRLAYCLSLTGQLPEALSTYRIALRYCPFRSAWWAELWTVARRTGDVAAAAEALKRLDDLDPPQAELLRQQATIGAGPSSPAPRATPSGSPKPKPLRRP